MKIRERFFNMLVRVFVMPFRSRRAKKAAEPELGSIVVLDRIESVFEQAAKKQAHKNVENKGEFAPKKFSFKQIIKNIYLSLQFEYENEEGRKFTSHFWNDFLRFFMAVSGGLLALSMGFNLWVNTANWIFFFIFMIYPAIYIIAFPIHVLMQYFHNKNAEKEVCRVVETINTSDSRNKASLIVAYYKEIIDKYRYRTIGTGTDFHDILTQCQSLKNQTENSLEYWRLRVCALEDPEEKKFGERQIKKAQDVQTRLAQVLEKLRKQKDELVRHFDEAESRLPKISSSVSDYFEAKKLEEIERRAGIVEEQAEDARNNILTGYVKDISRLLQSASNINVISHKALIQERELSLPLLESMADEINRGTDFAEKAQSEICKTVH